MLINLVFYQLILHLVFTLLFAIGYPINSYSDSLFSYQIIGWIVIKLIVYLNRHNEN